MHKATSANDFIAKNPEWRALLQTLRDVLLSTGLDETIKWGIPVYTRLGKNVVGMAAFKNHAALWFYQGALLKDRAGHLINAQQGKTRAQRQWRFRHDDSPDEKLIHEYILEAAEIAKRGESVKPRPKKPLPLPLEIKAAFGGNRRLKSAFEKITPYKQREYIEYISDAKREDTRTRRMNKIIPMILEGNGLNDRDPD